MRYGTLGDSGLLVSVVGLGCNNFGGRLDVEQTRAVVDAAIDEGITLFDTAETYGGAGASELALGEVLQGRRDKVVLATKFGNRNSDMGYGPAAGAMGSRNYIKVAVEKSLARLKTDYIDLYQVHTPDPVTPIEETLAALDDLVTEGKVRYLGHSNFSGWQIADAAHTALAPGGPRGHPAGRAAPGRVHHRRQARRGRVADRVGRGAGRLDPADRHRRPRRPARLLLGHRRRHLRRPGPGQRGGRPVAADRRPAGRHRQARPASRSAQIKLKGFKSS